MSRMMLYGQWLKDHGKLRNRAPRLAICLLIALLAWSLGKAWPLINAPLAGLLLGLVLGKLVKLPNSLKAGVTFTSRAVLQWALMAEGFRFSLRQLATYASSSLEIAAIVLACALVASLLVGRWLKFPLRMSCFTLACLVTSAIVIVTKHYRHGRSLDLRWLIPGFLLASGVDSLGLLPAELISSLLIIANGLLVIALVAVGINTVSTRSLTLRHRSWLMRGSLLILVLTLSTLGVQWLHGYF